MAIDSIAKRKAAMSMSGRGIIIQPDATFPRISRATMLQLYQGNDFDEPADLVGFPSLGVLNSGIIGGQI